MTRIDFNGRECAAEVGRYSTNRRPGVTLVDARSGAFVAAATVNYGDVPLAATQVLLADAARNQGLLEALEKAGVVRDTGGRLRSGLETHPVAELLARPPRQGAARQLQSDPLFRAALAEVAAWVGGSSNGVPWPRLTREGKRELLWVGVDWNPYIEQGLQNKQIGRIIDNAADGKPRERWLDGVKPARCQAGVVRRMAEAGQEAAQAQGRQRQRDRGR